MNTIRRGLFLGFLMLWGCSKSGPVDVSTKSPRDYVWDIDTLAYPGSAQTMMRDIWGSSPSNVYVVGHNDRGLGLMWRFDGEKWRDIKLVAAQGGKIDQAINLAAIAGTAVNNIWAVGMTLDINPNPPPAFVDSSLIIHFDGSQWEEQKIERGGPLWSISRGDAQELWTCGSGGTLFHYIGTSWVRDSIPMLSAPSNELSLWSTVRNSRGETFALGAIGQSSAGGIVYYFFERRNERWSVTDNFSFQSGYGANRFGIYGLWCSPEGTLYSFDNIIFRWTGSSWIKLHEEPGALRRMGGSSESNLFVVGDFGKVLHYDGVDWFEYSQLRNNNAVYSSVWTDGREAFIVGYLNDGSKTVILHGK